MKLYSFPETQINNNKLLGKSQEKIKMIVEFKKILEGFGSLI
nr:MAG TPA: hypothetical protein [Caudoviricetes sp.]